jgi:hypothetical protein
LEEWMNVYGRGALGFLASGMLAVLLPTQALAQEANAEAQGQVGMGLPGATATTTTTTTTTAGAAAAPGISDHDMMVGHLAVGYLGRRTIQVGAPGLDGAAVSAPVVGVRLWLDRALGLDLGVGLMMQNSSQENATADADGPNYFAMILHGGVPLALASAGHFAFLLVPELNIGFGSGSQETAAGDEDFSGFQIDAGARVGSEIHFGFMGIPQLSLQGSVGLLFSTSSAKTEVGPNELTQKTTRFQTAAYDNPWNIFTSNVAALYYF